MSYLHLHDIIHRDLKPDNIFMDDLLYPKVADFGIAKIIHSEKSETKSEKNVKTKIIQKDLQKAKTILEKFLKYQNAIVSLLYGKIMKKEESYAAAKNHFGKIIRSRNSKSKL